eukprot:55833-Hanusia_phi.AAC.2
MSCREKREGTRTRGFWSIVSFSITSEALLLLFTRRRRRFGWSSTEKSSKKRCLPSFNLPDPPLFGENPPSHLLVLDLLALLLPPHPSFPSPPLTLVAGISSDMSKSPDLTTTLSTSSRQQTQPNLSTCCNPRFLLLSRRTSTFFLPLPPPPSSSLNSLLILFRPALCPAERVQASAPHLRQTSRNRLDARPRGGGEEEEEEEEGGKDVSRRMERKTWRSERG